MIHVSVTVNDPGVTSRTCAVTKVIRNKRAVRHIHVKRIVRQVGYLQELKQDARSTQYTVILHTEWLCLICNYTMKQQCVLRIQTTERSDNNCSYRHRYTKTFQSGGTKKTNSHIRQYKQKRDKRKLTFTRTRGEEQTS
jgi:hypothetical protein